MEVFWTEMGSWDLSRDGALENFWFESFKVAHGPTVLTKGSRLEMTKIARPLSGYLRTTYFNELNYLTLP